MPVSGDPAGINRSLKPPDFFACVTTDLSLSSLTWALMTKLQASRDRWPLRNKHLPRIACLPPIEEKTMGNKELACGLGPQTQTDQLFQGLFGTRDFKDDRDSMPMPR